MHGLLQFALKCSALLGDLGRTSQSIVAVAITVPLVQEPAMSSSDDDLVLSPEALQGMLGSDLVTNSFAGALL